MTYSGHRKLLCELSKLFALITIILLGYQTNTDASILVYKFRPERPGFNMYAEYTQLQLTFLALQPTTYPQGSTCILNPDPEFLYTNQSVLVYINLLQDLTQPCLAFLRCQALKRLRFITKKSLKVKIFCRECSQFF